MGRFIILDEMLDNDHWVIPWDLVRYDQRYKPWPNELFPYMLIIDDFELQKDYLRVKIRRFCDQNLQGDVAVDKVYTNHGYRLIWQFWFELKSDYLLFGETWKSYIVEVE
jgi:hypothetical protein